MMPSDLLTGLVSSWGFNEITTGTAPDVGNGATDFEDEVGANHMLLNNGSQSLTPSILGNSAGNELSTPTVPIRVTTAHGDSNLPIPTAGDFSLVMMAYVPSTIYDFSCIFATCNTLQTQGLRMTLRNTAASYVVYCRVNSTNCFIGDLKPFIPDTWNQIGISHEHGVGMTLYVNGVNVSTCVHTAQVGNGNAGISVMARANNNNFAQYCHTTQLLYYHRQLLAAEFSELWNNGNGLAYPFNHPASARISIGSAKAASLSTASNPISRSVSERARK